MEEWGRGLATVKPHKSVAAHLYCKCFLLCSDMDWTTCSIKQKKHGNKMRIHYLGGKCLPGNSLVKTGQARSKKYHLF